MNIKFCSECGNLLVPNENKMSCEVCNITIEGTLESSEEIKQKEEKGKGIVRDENIYADFDHICEKCGHDKAQVIERPPYISDEDSLTYVKCGKCGMCKQLAKKIG